MQLLYDHDHDGKYKIYGAFGISTHQNIPYYRQTLILHLYSIKIATNSDMVYASLTLNVFYMIWNKYIVQLIHVRLHSTGTISCHKLISTYGDLFYLHIGSLSIDSDHRWIKQKTLKLVFVAFTLSTQY